MMLREATVLVRARWTARRARRWWDQLLAELVELAASQLGIPLCAIVAVDVEDPPEHSWSRRRHVTVRVHLLFLQVA